MDFRLGDTADIDGKKIIYVAPSCVFPNLIGKYLLPFSKESIPESKKCFLNGSEHKLQKASKTILTEKTYPFFKRRG